VMVPDENHPLEARPAPALRRVLTSQKRRATLGYLFLIQQNTSNENFESIPKSD
jgi:hypothetical protein